MTHTPTVPAGGKSTTFRITSDTGETAGTQTNISLTSTAVANGSIPTLSEWGLARMFLGLTGAMFHTMRKRPRAKSRKTNDRSGAGSPRGDPDNLGPIRHSGFVNTFRPTRRDADSKAGGDDHEWEGRTS